MYIVSFSPHNDPMKSVAYHPIIGSSSIRKVNFRKLTCLWSQGSWNSNSSHLNSNLCSFLINYFNWRLITLQYCSGFCLTLTWISHGCTCVPHPEPPSYLPPHPIPQGHPSAPALSTLSHSSNLDWQSVYTCFSAVLSNHLALAFSYRVQKSVLYIYVSLAVSHTGS